MKVCTIEDIEAVDRVLKHTSVYNRIFDDNCPKVESFSAEKLLQSDCHIIMANKDTIFVFIPHNSSTFDVHVTSTPEGRKDKAIKSGYDATEYAFTQIDGCKKLICFIPEIYKNVMRYVEKLGFEEEGVITESYLKNDKLHNEHIYGLRRSSWALEPQQ